MLKPEPVLLPRRIRALPAMPKRPTLGQRFRKAATPGDWIALIIGAQLGVGLVTVLVVASAWDVIAPALAALL